MCLCSTSADESEKQSPGSKSQLMVNLFGKMHRVGLQNLKLILFGIANCRKPDC